MAQTSKQKEVEHPVLWAIQSAKHIKAQCMLILKNNRVEKVSLTNVKTFISRKDSCAINNEKNRPYNLRKRKNIINYAETSDMRNILMVKL